MASNKKDIQEVEQPQSQGEKNFKGLHNPVNHKNFVPGVTDQDHLFNGSTKPYDNKFPNSNNPPKDIEVYDKNLKIDNSKTKNGYEKSTVGESKNWIQKAIKKPGALHKQLHVASDEKIPEKKLEKAAEKGGKLGQRARLAMTLRKMKEEVEQVDELDRQPGSILNRYISKTDPEHNHPKEVKKRRAGRALALKKKWGDKNYGTPEPNVKAVHREEFDLDEGFSVKNHSVFGKILQKDGHTVLAGHDEAMAHAERYKGATLLKTLDRKKYIVKMPEHMPEGPINESLSKAAPAADWIEDFINSDNPKFEGKSKEERRKMAIAAYYSKQNEEVEQVDEIFDKTPEGRKKLASYIQKASDSLENKTWDKGLAAARDNEQEFDKAQKITNKRGTGIIKALKRLTKEEAEQVDENWSLHHKGLRSKEEQGDIHHIAVEPSKLKDMGISHQTKHAGEYGEVHTFTHPEHGSVSVYQSDLDKKGHPIISVRSNHKVGAAKHFAKHIGGHLHHAYNEEVEQIDEAKLQGNTIKTKTGTATITPTHVHFSSPKHKIKFLHALIDHMARSKGVVGEGEHGDEEDWRGSREHMLVGNKHVFYDGEHEHHLPKDWKKHIPSSTVKEEVELDEEHPSNLRIQASMAAKKYGPDHPKAIEAKKRADAAAKMKKEEVELEEAANKEKVHNVWGDYVGHIEKRGDKWHAIHKVDGELPNISRRGRTAVETMLLAHHSNNTKLTPAQKAERKKAMRDSELKEQIDEKMSKAEFANQAPPYGKVTFADKLALIKKKHPDADIKTKNEEIVLKSPALAKAYEARNIFKK